MEEKKELKPLSVDFSQSWEAGTWFVRADVYDPSSGVRVEFDTLSAVVPMRLQLFLLSLHLDEKTKKKTQAKSDKWTRGVWIWRERERKIGFWGVEVRRVAVHTVCVLSTFRQRCPRLSVIHAFVCFAADSSGHVCVTRLFSFNRQKFVWAVY